MPDNDINQKLDGALSAAYRAWQQENNTSDVDAGISVLLRYEGDLGAIEALGFETHMVSGSTVLGIVRFKDIPALVGFPGVLWITAGRRKTLDLDSAVPDIKARTATLSGSTPAGGVWHADDVSGTLRNLPDGTGEEVVVAIIDTGIDYKHPMFMSQLTPRKETRIVRIWDQGLTPTNVTDCPDKNLLASANTYGVEYDDTEIETDLNGGTPILHRDCDGHGTHCAGIAAGGTTFPLTPTRGDAKKVGVAPRASIIMVKYLDVPDTIRFRLPANTDGDPVFPDARFVDAVVYCLRTARDVLNKPVVISISAGNSGKPGDGLDEEAVFIDGLLDPNAAAGPDNFPRGAILVKSAGNNGNVAQHRSAKIVVPAAGQIVVPLELLDTRETEYQSWERCAKRVFKPRISAHFWYRAPAAVGSVQFAMRPPNESIFSANVSNGAELELGYIPVVGPPPRVADMPVSTAVHSIGLDSEIPGPVAHPSGSGSVHRHYIRFFVRPKESSGAVTYNRGIYEVRITAPAGTLFYLMCPPQSWGPGLSVRFRVSAIMQNGTPRPAPPDITVTEESSSVDSLGRNVITVAAYDDQNGGGSIATRGRIASFSSRGPLRDFSDPASPRPVIAAKPDIAAPGVDIMSADGIDTEPPPPPAVRLPTFWQGIRFTSKQGTSMATPMVAGVIALMLDKKGDLNITEARTTLHAAPRPVIDPSTAPNSTNAYGRGRVDALTSHSNT
jgi:subtilisin family serine protease